MSTKAMITMAQRAQKASEGLGRLTESQRNDALNAMAQALRQGARAIVDANQKDVALAKASGLGDALISRLTLDEARVAKMADSVSMIAGLPDPLGRILWERVRPNGLTIRKVAVPIGVILIIYESRPNVTADCMALCLKSGNSVILKGGSEALRTNQAIYRAMNQAACSKGVPAGAFEFVTEAGRTAAKTLLTLDRCIDLVIPRGGEGLIREVARLSRIPVIKHYKGICHVYVDKEADLKKAAAIALNAKTQNCAVCNAMETLLVDESVAKAFLPTLGSALKACKVEVRGCPKTRKILPKIKRATEEDWSTEYLDLILSVRVVAGVEEAVRHIQRYGSRHSDAIVTENIATARFFTQAVDSACVFVNCSTRFSDGGEFGMGAEMGISTDKLHARGPMGLEELTSYKYVVTGNGQVRA